MNNTYEPRNNSWSHQITVGKKDGKIKFNKDFNFDSFNHLETEYVKNNKRPFYIHNVDVIRDGGTLVLESYTTDRQKYYLHKDNYTIHSNYPTLDSNMVTDESTIFWIIKSYHNYITGLENEVQLNKNRLHKIIKK